MIVVEAEKRERPQITLLKDCLCEFGEFLRILRRRGILFQPVRLRFTRKLRPRLRLSMLWAEISSRRGTRNRIH
jgi:hypothetical protein